MAQYNEFVTMALNFLYSYAIKTIKVPTDFHERCAEIKSYFESDNTGLVNSLLDFAIESCSDVEYTIETKNTNLDAIFEKWLNNINIGYNGKIPIGINELAKEYFKERWKGASFPILKIAKWERIEGILFPMKMYFIDGGSVYADDKNSSLKKLLNYEYYIGKEKKIPLGDDVIITNPYGRWYDKYPVPFLIKRGIYINAKLLKSILDKQGEVLEKIIPIVNIIKRGTESLALNKVKIYNDSELAQIKERLENLYKELRKNPSKIATRVTQFDEEWNQVIPNIDNMFKEGLFSPIEKRILAGLGFIDIADAVSSSRRESILNPKPFIQELKSGISDFKSQIINTSVRLIINVNSSNRKYFSDNNKIRVTSSPLKGFMTSDVMNQLRMLWERGQLSNKTYAELVGEVDYQLEVTRREKELKNGLEIIMYPHQIRNEEQYESYLETIRNTKQPDKDIEIKPDETKKNPLEKQNYDVGKLETSPYKKISDLPVNIKKVLDIDLQRVFIKVFNNAYEEYNNDTIAFRVAWSVIKKLGKKNKKGVWVLKKKVKVNDSSFADSKKYFKNINKSSIDETIDILLKEERYN